MAYNNGNATSISGKPVNVTDPINNNDGIFFDSSSGTWKNSPAAVQATNTFLIEQESDFPNQDGTTITLDEGFYVIRGVIVTSKNFQISDGAIVQLKGLDAFADGIVYTGTGSMFTGDDFATFSNVEMFISCPTANVYDIQALAPNSAAIYFLSSFTSDCSGLGTVKNVDTFAMNFSAWFDVGTGITLDTIRLVFLSDCQNSGWKNQATSYMTVQGTFSQFLMDSFTTSPKSNETTFDIKNTVVVSTGSVTGSPVDLSEGGSVFASGSLDQNAISWKYSGNKNIPDSQAIAEQELKGNSTNTVVGSVNNPTLVAGTWTDLAIRFITTAAGRATYIGEENINVALFANPEIVLTTGTNKDVTMYFSIGNDTNNTISSFADAGGGQITVTTDNSHGLSNGDRVVITGTTNYNGTYTISNVTANTFEITDTFVATETGFWQIILEKSSSSQQIASTTKSSNIPTLSTTPLVTNDFVEMFIENNSDGTALLVKNCNYVVA